MDATGTTDGVVVPEVPNRKEKQVIQDELRLATETIHGREYECVAFQLQRVHELTELLKDAHNRLSNNWELSRIEKEMDDPIIRSLEWNALY